ncbi:hypothetical protein WICMUC_002748 [Wickerhamomyces mucosus]|uniref:TBP-associated factor 12 n=1 Tax=Wickerhamomyces mucosus TaxID=1378264 RepID=A0A9P8PQ25_9ASCO|nr:hypothetical protein WICMUC_002748 [Wickerhamomyces mucosus]
MSQQPNQNTQNKPVQQGGRPNNQQTIDLSRLQPAQLQALIAQMNQCQADAQKLGVETPAGKENLLKYQRIKMLLNQYSQQMSRQQQQSQQNPQIQQQQTGSQQVQTNRQAPQQNQQQYQQYNQANQPKNDGFNQNVSQRPIQQVQQQQPNTNFQRNQTASPSPSTVVPNSRQNFAQQGQQQMQTPQSQQQQPKATPLQQYQQLQNVLPEFVKRLEKIEESKKSGNLSAEQLAKLSEQEAAVRSRYTSYQKLKAQLEQQLKQQAAQQQQQQISQSGNSHSGSPQLMQNQSLVNNAPNTPDTSHSQPMTPKFQNNQQPQQQIPRSQQSNNYQYSQQNIALNQQPQQSNNNVNVALSQSNLKPNFQSSSQDPNNIQQHQVPIQQQNSQLQHQTQLQQQPQQQPQQNLQQQPQSQPHSQPHLQAQPQQSQQSVSIPASQRKVIQSQNSNPLPQENALNQGGIGRSIKSASPNAAVTNVNAAARPTNNINNGPISASNTNVFKSAVPPSTLSASINVKPPTPVQATQNRPTLTGGKSVAAPSLTTPAMLKLPPYEMQGDRVLSKRKLSELVKTVGADEGDGETIIDGDVEELLLDLADEFVTNITSFACRLAKHRKSENLQAKDIQLHLEKNWNIRVPGFASDEIRSVRKWPANSNHVQRVQGIDISKSVEQNK